MFTNQMQAEIDLCNLLQTLKLHNEAKESTTVAMMSDENAMVEDLNYLSDGASEASTSSPNIGANSDSNGCAYLRIIKSQLESFTTTGGEYLDAIFTHREILSAYPEGHQHCSKAFSDIAYALEKRAWRADREADTEAVSAFRHEAWMIAAALRPATQWQSTHSKNNLACSMPLM